MFAALYYAIARQDWIANFIVNFPEAMRGCYTWGMGARGVNATVEDGQAAGGDDNSDECAAATCANAVRAWRVWCHHPQAAMCIAALTESKVAR